MYQNTTQMPHENNKKPTSLLISIFTFIKQHIINTRSQTPLTTTDLEGEATLKSQGKEGPLTKKGKGLPHSEQPQLTSSLHPIFFPVLNTLLFKTALAVGCVFRFRYTFLLYYHHHHITSPPSPVRILRQPLSALPQ